MEKLEPHDPAPGASVSRAWDAACLRIEDFLRAHGVEPRERVISLTLELMREARELHARDGELSPVGCAMRLLVAKADVWFEGLAGEPAGAARARLAFFASGKPQLFLRDELPQDFVGAIRNAGIAAGPSLEFQSLIRKEIDYGALEDIAKETWDKFSWGHVFRAFAIWAVIFFVSWWAILRFFP